MKRVIGVIFTGFVLLAIVFAGCAKPAEVRIIRAITDCPVTDVNGKIIAEYYVDAVNKRLEGQAKIEWMGGHDVIGQNEQADALKNGVMDLQLFQARGRITSLVPACWASDLTQLNGAEERISGAFDVWAEAFKKHMNCVYLGLGNNGEGLSTYIWVNKKVEKLADLEGMPIRTYGLFESVAKALGASPMSIPLPDVYSAVQRGVVDGLMTNLSAFSSFRIYEVCKYVLDHPFMQGPTVVLMNQDAFNSLPKNVQDVLMEEAINLENFGLQNANSAMNGYWAKIEGGGTERIKLNAEDAETLLAIVGDIGWDFALAKDDTGYAARLRPLMTKK